MSETSGFFISQGGDRKYTPAWLASYIEALVTTGVYKDELAVTAGDGMTISLPYGRAWLKGYLYINDAPMAMVIGNADSVLDRKDSVVIRLNLTDRTIRAMVLQGTFSASPAAPAPTRNADIFDLKLAEINIPAGTTKITQDNILDTRLDDAVCGLTVCTVQHIPTSTFLAQMTAEFKMWFEDVKGQLSEDVAGHLYQMIQEVQGNVDKVAGDIKLSEDTKTALGLGEDATLDDVFAALKERIDAKQIQSVSGSKSFSSDTTDLTLPFLPDYLIAHFQLKRKDGTPYFYGFATAIFSDATGFNRTMYFSVAGNTSANYAGYVKIATVLDESSLKFSCTKTLKNIAETSQSNATIDVLYEAIKLNGGLFK